MNAPANTPATGKPEWAMSRREIERVLRARAGLPPPPRRWPWVLGVLVLLAVAGAVGFRVIAPGIGDATGDATAVIADAGRVEEATDSTPALRINAAEFMTLAPVTLERTVRVTGALEPVRRAQLSAQVSAQVDQVTVRPGDTVAAGDTLVQLDVEPLTIELELQRSNAAATRAQLALAETRLGRAETLRERGVATESTLDDARSSAAALRANLEAQEAQVHAAEVRLSHATVTAPFAGMVASRDAEPGQFVGVGAPLVAIVDLSTVELRAGAPVTAGTVLKPGQSVTVVVRGIGQEAPRRGVIERISPVASEGTRTLPVHIAIANPDGDLRGGMFATGEIVIGRVESALAVPTGAVREDAAGRYVLRIAADRVERADVATADEWPGEMTRITAGLAPGDRVVVAPLDELTPGASIELMDS